MRDVRGEHLGQLFSLGRGATVELRAAREHAVDRGARRVEQHVVADGQRPLLMGPLLEQFAGQRQLSSRSFDLDVADLGVDA